MLRVWRMAENGAELTVLQEPRSGDCRRQSGHCASQTRAAQLGGKPALRR
jgi:hypothetical protein